MTIRQTLDDAIAALRGIPHVVLESALVLPAPTSKSLKEFEERTGIELPAAVVQLYAEVGGAHISWRLSATGYDQLEPDRPDNMHRYDVSGNLDLLSLEEISDGFTGHGWEQPYGHHAKGYRPLDFSSFFVSLGFTPSESQEANSLVVFILYDNRRSRLDMPLTEYIQLGAELLFMNDWQLALLGDEEAVKRGAELRRVKGQLAMLID